MKWRDIADAHGWVEPKNRQEMNEPLKPANKKVTEKGTLTPEKVIEVMMQDADLNEGRNNIGFKIACQIRDNGFDQGECHAAMTEWLYTVSLAGDHPYSEPEMRQSISQAYSEPARQPWTALPDRTVNATFEPSEPKTKPKPQGKLTTSDHRDMILDHWAETAQSYRYIAEWETWYTYHNGVYQVTLPDKVKQDITSFLENNEIKIKEHDLNDIMAKIRRAEGVFIEHGPAVSPYLNLRNGLLDVDTLELIPHTPQELVFAQAPTSFDLEGSAPKFNAFIERVCPNYENRQTLQEFLGYSLTHHTFLEKSLYVKGPGRTGKGTLTTVMRALLSGQGRHGLAAAMSIGELKDNSHSLVNAVGKRLILIDEVPARADLNGFKKIVGQDEMLINPKNKTPYNVKLEAKIIISANTNISTGDDNTNNSIDRRLIILPFDVVADAEHYNPRIKEELTTPEELAGILLWCLVGWHRLKGNNYRFTNDGDAEQRIEFFEASNPTMTFLRECLEPVDWNEPQQGIKASELFQMWKVWCEGSTVNIFEGQYDKYGNEKVRWEKRGGSGHYAGSDIKFKAKVMEGSRVLDWKILQRKKSDANYWYGMTPKK